MMVERISPESLGSDYPDFDYEKFADNDLKIRNGECPNGHGLLIEDDDGQECSTCGFFTNIKSELTSQ